MITIISPSLDDKRIYPLTRLVPGEVHRTRVVLRHASGKGANAARAAAAFGGHVLLCAFAGRDMQEQLEEQLAFSTVRLDLTATQQPTRSCVTVLEEDGKATELVQEALPVEKEEADRYIDRAMAACRGSAAVLLTGSLPAGLPEDFYSRCGHVAREEDALVVIDAQRQPLLRILSDVTPDIVKINREELGNTIGSEVPREAVRDAVEAFRERSPMTVIITDGSLPVQVFPKDETAYEIIPPPVQAINPVGSGDVLSGALTFALSEGNALEGALRFAVAAAAANAASLLPGVIEEEHVRALLGK